MGYWDSDINQEASDKSFAYGIRITHDNIEAGKTYDQIRTFLMEEKHFENDTIDRIFEIVRKKRRDMVDGEKPVQEDAWAISVLRCVPFSS